MDEVALKEHLKSFPSTVVDFEPDQLKSKEKITELIQKLQQDDHDTQKTKEEKIKIYNFISYLYYLKRKMNDALEYCNKSLALDQNNLTATANKCHFLLEREDLYGAREVMDLLLKMKTEKESFDERLLYAKAELAYAYSRSGPSYHEKAENVYQKIIEQRHDEYSWKFGIGITLIRQTHMFISQKENMQNKEGEMLSKAIGHLLDVTQNAKDDDQLRGKAWIELGKIMYSISKSENRKNVTVPDELLYTNREYCFVKALEICPDEPFVLEQSGKYYRYFQNIEKSEALLRQSLELHKTCFAYHHLALTLKRKVEMENSTMSPRRTLSSPSGSAVFDNQSCRRKLEFDTMSENFESLSMGDRSHRGHERFPHFCIPRVPTSTCVQQYPSHNRRPQRGIYGSIRPPRGRYTTQRSSHSDTTFHLEPFDSYGNTNYAHYNFRSQAGVYGNNRRFNGNSRQQSRIRSRTPRRNSYQRTLSENSLKSMVKSPLKLTTYPDNPILLEAVECLEKAVTISRGALIIYDLALMYRTLDMPHEALEELNKITMQKSRMTLTNVLMVNIYEQKGLCLLELCKRSSDQEVKRKLQENGKTMLYKAIEQQAMLIKKDQIFKCAWNSYPTLKALLMSARDSSSMNNLAKIYRMMSEHEEAIGILRKLEDHNEGHLTVREYEELIENHVALRHFSEAISLLELLECTEEFSQLDKRMIMNTYIQGALQSINEGDIAEAHSRFRSVYNVIRNPKRQVTELRDDCHSATQSVGNKQTLVAEEEDGSRMHVQILHLCPQGDECTAPKKLQSFLSKYTGLTITVNCEDSLPGVPESKAMLSTMESSENIVIFHQKGTSADELYYQHALKHLKKVIILADMCCTVPEIFNIPSVPCIRLPSGYIKCNRSCEGFQESVSNSDADMNVLKEIFENFCKKKL